MDIESMSDDELRGLVKRCIEVLRKRRPGIYARDIDKILAADRRLYCGLRISKRRTKTLGELIPKILVYEEMGNERQ
jgi:hypothetical protein